MISPAAVERFWSKVEKRGPDECWVWTPPTLDTGYGQFWMDGKQRRAHRLSWTMENGPIPNGLCALHTCDVRACVNPAHLFLGTKADNNADRDAKGRQVFAKGERHGSAKLARELVRQIRHVYPAKSQRRLAAIFGVSQHTICDIVNRRTWTTILDRLAAEGGGT